VGKVACAYWLKGAAASHLDEISTADWFVFIKLQVQQSRAVMIYEDGNSHEHACQEITYTAFHSAASSCIPAGIVQIGSSCCPINIRRRCF
jgi:hypothetical protein